MRCPPRRSSTGSGPGEVAALVWSQVILSVLESAVAAPLVRLTGDAELMAPLANRRRTRRVVGVVVAVLIVLN